MLERPSAGLLCVEKINEGTAVSANRNCELKIGQHLIQSSRDGALKATPCVSVCPLSALLNNNVASEKAP